MAIIITLIHRGSLLSKYGGTYDVKPKSSLNFLLCSFYGYQIKQCCLLKSVLTNLTLSRFLANNGSGMLDAMLNTRSFCTLKCAI